ncbi:MAG: nitroreductase family protein [Promethearchaeota archaeon]|jgi:nitroreductase/NAD-dependent dihydropyrimidine dehydrogenase PreA subunit
MPIKGINIEKCSVCKSCIRDCPTKNYRMDDTEKQIVFNDSNCVLCGHCIAVCPENAILYKDMQGNVLDSKESSKPPTYETLHQLMVSKRTIRQYKNKKVPDELLQKVLDSMSSAPTAMNARTLKCIVVSDKQKIKEFTNAVIDTIGSEEERVGYKKKLEQGPNPFFYNAPHILLLYSKSSWGVTDAPIAITYGMLSAETLGLGSCWIGGIQRYLMKNKEIQKKIFGIEDDIHAIMILGYPAVKYYRNPPRSSIETKII